MSLKAGLVAAATLTALAPAGAEAGPWALGRGRLYAKAGYSYLPSRTLANPDGSESRIPRFVKQDLVLYVAYGIDDRLTASLNLPAVRSSDLDGFGSETGAGDVQIGLQLQLGKGGGWVFATRGSLQVPTGDESRAQGILPTGSGVYESELVLGAGRSLGRGRGWAFLEAGYQYRELLRDGFVYAGQLGWNVTPRLALAANLRGLEPWDASAREVAIGSFVGVGDRVTYLVVGPTALVKLVGGLGLQLDLDLPLRAKNLATGNTFRVGFYYSR